MLFAEKLLVNLESPGRVMQGAIVVARVVVHNAEIVVGRSGAYLFLSQGAAFDQQGLFVELDCLIELTHAFIHVVNVVVGPSGARVFLSQGFELDRQGFFVELNCPIVLAFGVIHHVKVVVALSGVLVVLAQIGLVRHTVIPIVRISHTCTQTHTRL